MIGIFGVLGLPDVDDESDNIPTNPKNQDTLESSLSNENSKSKYNNTRRSSVEYDSENMLIENNLQNTEDISISFPIDNSTVKLAKQTKQAVTSVLRNQNDFKRDSLSDTKNSTQVTSVIAITDRDTGHSSTTIIKEKKHDSSDKSVQDTFEVKQEGHYDDGRLSSENVEVYEVFTSNKENVDTETNKLKNSHSDIIHQYEQAKISDLNSSFQDGVITEIGDDASITMLNSEIDLEKLHFDYLTRYTELYPEDNRKEFQFFIDSIPKSELQMSYATWLDYKAAKIQTKFETIQKRKLKIIKDKFQVLKDTINNLDLYDEEDMNFLHRLFENMKDDQGTLNN